ncbi:hypothetical protein [Ornithinimicrobium cavernae]|uniref:hypothetical protein n=1 Tax=Ornithinimicrobium cavernae TaxID=2666047 RepID=UPI000D69001D|nr:hypothetical protein [Ornithinimicrobium cavernae]
MSYGNDPRAKLASSPKTAPTATGARTPQYYQFDLHAPAEQTEAGSPTWYFRGQNFVLAQTRLQAGDTLEVTGAEQEYVVLLTEATADVTVRAGEESEQVSEHAVIVVPAGDSRVEAHATTVVSRLFDVRSPLVERAANAEAYAEADPIVAPLVPWPDPVGGARLRVYLPERVEAEPGRFGRIYRTSSFMINFLDEQHGPRDPEKLSPHHHDDFEQCSFVLEGSYVHHIRAPWTPRRSEWYEDQHQYIGAPSATIIPPPTVHTSEAVGLGLNRMVDIFCPPREDFSAMDGWVLNAEDYPQPEREPSA